MTDETNHREPDAEALGAEPAPETRPEAFTHGVLKFVTPWAPWSQRWADSKMAPWHAPFFVSVLPTGVAIVGPYLSERFEIRPELVSYASLEAAFAELNLVADDCARVDDWMNATSGQLDPCRGAVADLVKAAAGEDLAAYRAAAIHATTALVAQFRKLLPGGEPVLSDHAAERMFDRDVAITVADHRRLGLEAASKRAGGVPPCPPNTCEVSPHPLAIQIHPPRFRAICRVCGAASIWPPEASTCPPVPHDEHEQLAALHGHEVPQPVPVVIPVPPCARGCGRDADHHDAEQKPACATCDAVVTK